MKNAVDSLTSHLKALAAKKVILEVDESLLRFETAYALDLNSAAEFVEIANDLCDGLVYFYRPIAAGFWYQGVLHVYRQEAAAARVEQSSPSRPDLVLAERFAAELETIYGEALLEIQRKSVPAEQEWRRREIWEKTLRHHGYGDLIIGGPNYLARFSEEDGDDSPDPRFETFTQYLARAESHTIGKLSPQCIAWAQTHGLTPSSLTHGDVMVFLEDCDVLWLSRDATTRLRERTITALRAERASRRAK